MKYGLIKKIFLLIFAYVLQIPLNMYAAKPADCIPDDLIPAVNHLLNCVESNEKKPVNLELIPPILDFVEASKELGKTISLGEHDGTVSDYYEFLVNRSLEKVLDLAYNPDLPANLTQPSSVRLSRWIGLEEKNVFLPRLSDELSKLDKPIIISGVEFIENSPDTFSGAYYSYNVDRLLILIKHKGHPALISVSYQKGVSDVGKKGLVLGNDEEWNYIYSGEKGTTLPGTGWADTYMYGSASITVYYELDMNPGQVKCAIFKWLSAGWMGLNFVKPAHIRKGLERFAKDFREVVESTSLADTGSLAQMYKKIHALSLDELRVKIAEYYNQKKISRFQLENPRYKKLIAGLFKEGRYISRLNRQEMEALVCLEYLKYKMGKYDVVESDYFP